MQLQKSVLEAFKSCTIDRQDDRWILKTSQMSRKDYEQFKRIVNSMRGEWIRKMDAHVFGHDPSAEIAAMVETGFAPSYVENPFSFFPTPREDVEEMVTILARLQDRLAPRVAETGAGDGRIIKSILKACPGADVRYWEIDDRNLELLKPLNAKCEGRDFLAPDFEYLNGTFDFVLMNPEFNGKQYQKHIRRAFELLKPGGQLISIVPAMAISDKAFRNWMFKGTASWYPGEYEFTDTKVKYATVHLRKGWEQNAPPCGYASWGVYHAYHASVALHSDAQFWDSIKRVRSIDDLRNTIEGAIDRIVRFDQVALCLDTETLDALVLEFSEELGVNPPQQAALPDRTSDFMQLDLLAS